MAWHGFVVKNTPEVLLGGNGKGEVVRGLEGRQALVCVSHVRGEVPGVVRDWLCLPSAESGEVVRRGRFGGPLEGVEGGWEGIWGEKGGGEEGGGRRGRGRRGGGRRGEGVMRTLNSNGADCISKNII